MAETDSILKLFHEARNHSIAPKTLKDRIDKLGMAPEAADERIARMIDDGWLASAGGDKSKPHPRAKASYKLTQKGQVEAREAHRPARPADFSDEEISAQGAFVLLQMFLFRNDPKSGEKVNPTRSEILGKLKGRAVLQNLGLGFGKDADEETRARSQAALDYLIYDLVERKSVEPIRVGASHRYRLTDEGVDAIGSSQQYDSDGLEIRITGKKFNELMEAARRSASTSPAAPTADRPSAGATDAEADAPPTPRHAVLTPEMVMEQVDRLQADKYEGQGQIPIHEVRQLVREALGDELAGRKSLDPVLMRMRADGRFNIIPLGDGRHVTQHQIDESIPQGDATLFYIVLD